MKFIKYLVLAFIIALPINVFGGIGVSSQTDISASNFLTAPYDLRNRNSYVQVTNIRNESINIHVQIFQHDRGCSEINFNDTLTANDTVVYDLDNLVKNNGSSVPANLLDDSSGYVVITVDDGDGAFFVDGGSFEAFFDSGHIIGNIRIIDVAGYEYRTNMAGIDWFDGFNASYANFNTVDNAMYSDVIGYLLGVEEVDSNPPQFLLNTTVVNFDFGMDFDIFVFDMNEEPLSCDRRNFACGNVMNYGVNEDYPNSKGGPLLCPGGGLADPKGGYILFDNGNVNFPNQLSFTGPYLFYGFIGINNNNGTGSFDSWFQPFEDQTE